MVESKQIDNYVCVQRLISPSVDSHAEEYSRLFGDLPVM